MGKARRTHGQGRAGPTREGGQAQHLVLVYIDDPAPLRPYAPRVNYNGRTNPAQGNLFPRTPVIDGLAHFGVTFTHARNAPVCSPGRASLLTGVYPFRHGVGSVVEKDRDGALKEFLDPGFEFPTLPVTLGRGVHTGIVGKIHLSTDVNDEFENHPGEFGIGWEVLDRIGFDFAATTLRNVGKQPVPGAPTDASQGGYYRYYFNRGSDNDHRASQYPSPDPYNTTLLVDQAIQFLSDIPRGKRAFLYLSFNAAHGPFGGRGPGEEAREFPPEDLVATQEYVDLKDHATQWPVWLAMMEAVDKELGRLRSSIPREVRERTTFVVMGDNGIENTALKNGRDRYQKDMGPDWDFVFDQREERLKSSVYHWGTSVPLIWAGPRPDDDTVADPGRTSAVAVDAVDLPVTIARYFGVEHPPCDGVDFLDAAWHGVDFRKHARQQNFAEHFHPLGDRFSGDLEVDDQGLWKWLLDDAFREKGRYSLVRRQGVTDELYRLEDEGGGVVDLFERVPLDIEGTHAKHYKAMVAALEELVDPGDRITPSPPPKRRSRPGRRPSRRRG